MKLENQQLLQEFYEKNKHLYPNLTFQQVKDCIVTSYSYTKQNMENGEFPVIRLKYLCTFAPSLGKINNALKTMKKAFEELKLDGKFYFPRKKQLEEFLLKQETLKEDEEDESGEEDI